MVARASAQRAAPGYLLDKIPRPEGAQYSVARFAGSVNSGGDLIPGLRSSRYSGLAHPGLPSAAAPRLVDADIALTRLFSWRYQGSAQSVKAAADVAIARFSSSLVPLSLD